MFDLKKNIVPNKAFIDALGITQYQFLKKNENGSFSQDEREIIYNVLKNYPSIYPNVPLLEKYMRFNNINVITFTKKLNVQNNFFYTFKAIPLSDEPQQNLIDMLRADEPLNMNKLVDPLANQCVKKLMKLKGVNHIEFRKKFLNDHKDYKRYLTSYCNLFLNLDYTDDMQDYFIDYINNHY